jgi:ABC-type phosphate transport system auxiliary subunit
MDQDMVSFVLRFVREAGEEQQARWRGVVKHVQSNSEASFSQFSEAFAFMQSYVNDIAQASYEETARMGQNFGDANAFATNPFAETTRLWGDFVPRYTQMMMDSMNEAMASSADMVKPMEEMVDSTLSAWGMPSRAGQSEQAEKQDPAEAMAAMTAQMAALNEKIAALENQLSELSQEDEESE